MLTFSPVALILFRSSSQKKQNKIKQIGGASLCVWDDHIKHILGV